MLKSYVQKYEYNPDFAISAAFSFLYLCLRGWKMTFYYYLLIFSLESLGDLKRMTIFAVLLVDKLSADKRKESIDKPSKNVIL